MTAGKMIKKEHSIYLSVRELAKRIRKEVRDEISMEYEKARKQDKYPWEGMWLTSQDINKFQTRLKKRDRAAFMEIVLLFVFLTLFTSAFLQIIYSVIPQPDETVILPYLDIASQSDSDSSVLTDTIPITHFNQREIIRAESNRKESADKHATKEEINQTAEPIRGNVAINILRLRKGPGIDYPIIARLKYGVTITVQDTAGEWIKIVTDTFMVGWVFREYIELDTSSLKREFSYNEGIESQPFTRADKDQTIRMETEPQEVRLASALMTDHAEMTDAPSDSITEERNHEKQSQYAEAGGTEYVIQVGAWKHPAYAENVLTKLKRYYPGVRKVHDNDLIKIIIPDVKNPKQGYVIQKHIERNFNLSPILTRIDRERSVIEKEKEESTGALPGIEISSPVLNSDSAEDAANKTGRDITDKTRHEVHKRTNINPRIALIVTSNKTGSNEEPNKPEKAVSSP